MSISLIDRIMETGSRNPAAPAFIHQDQVITYNHLRAFLCVVAKMLHERGVRPGDVVGLAMAQSPLHCIAMLSLASLGAVSVPLSASLKIEDQLALIRRYGIHALVTDRDNIRISGVTVIRLNNITVSDKESYSDSIYYRPDTETPIYVALSSGTTGEPKGVLHTHGSLLDRIEKTLYCCDQTSRLIPPDLHVTVGLVFAVGILCCGGVVVFPRTYDLLDMVAAINLYAVTHILLSPAKAAQISSLLPKDGIAFPTLSHLRIVGSTPAEKLLVALREKFSQHIYVPYGLTELGVVSLATPETLSMSPKSAGKLMPWARAEAIDKQGGVLPFGQSGEIRLSVEGMPKGYFCDSGRSEGKFRDGWFYPGDMGQISSAGLLTIEGRIDNILNIGGHKVTAEYVEDMLVRHPEVREAVVFLFELDGEEILAAAIISDGNKIIQDIVEHCKRHLGVLAPEKFFFVRDFPRNAGGKLSRAEIPAMASTMMDDKKLFD